MSAPSEDFCDNCGAVAAGREQWMFSNGGAGKRFICFRCLGWMRLYATIGFSLLAITLLAIIGFLWWVKAIP
jgi:hypothetical protein